MRSRCREGMRDLGQAPVESRTGEVSAQWVCRDSGAVIVTDDCVPQAEPEWESQRSAAFWGLAAGQRPEKP